MDFSNIGRDKIAFLATQVASIPVGFLYWKYLSPFRVSNAVRHGAGAVIGFVVLVVLFQWSAMHIVLQTLGSYLIIRLFPSQTSHLICCVFAMSYNGIIIYLGSFSEDRNAFDITLKYPTLLETFGYAFYFGGIFLGPGFSYTDYKDFIEGENILSDKKYGENGIRRFMTKNGKTANEKSRPSPLMPTVKNFLLSCLYLTTFLLGAKYLPPEETTDVSLVEHLGFIRRVLFVAISLHFYLHRLLFIYKIGETVQNASGFGLHYQDGKPEWNLTTNIDYFKVMTAPDVWRLLKYWNIFTSRWLRHLFYERAGKYGLLLSFTMNYIWHGTDLGYFVLFHTLGLGVLAARKAHYTIRPYFEETRWKKLYDVLTWFLSQALVYYAFAGSYLLKPNAVLQFYTYSMYWWGHILILIIMMFPGKGKHKKSSKK